MNHKLHIEASLATLKDFQKATVDYVVKKMNEGQNKFLIADEVGLGKTIVAKGIIASLYDQQYSLNKDFRIIYICSNQALAKQNLTKLNFIKDQAESIIEYNGEDDRLTSLAYEPRNLKNDYKLKIKALTPATSFDNKRKAGKADERVLLYRLLLSIPGMKYRQTSLKWFLKGGQQISEKTWEGKIDEAYKFENNLETSEEVRGIRKEVYTKFKAALKNRLSDLNQKEIFRDIKDSRTILSGLFHILEERKQNRTFKNGRDIVFKNLYSLISELRLQLSFVCKDYLEADVFILDEFQKFSQLIRKGETENKGEEIARIIFADANAKVLLLSATPFKAYTNAFEEHNGENHYKEFKTVLQFLYPDKPGLFWDELEEKNKRFFSGIKEFGSERTDIDSVQLISLKGSLENAYRQCMTRTERILVEQDDKSKTSDSIIYLNVQADDIKDFIAIDELIIESNKLNNDKLSHPIEYVKSSPFPLSFLQDYDHHKVLKKSYSENLQLQKLIKKSKKAFVPIDRINAYKPLLPEKSINEPNPKLRLLYDETVRNNGFKLLWIPPSLKYYQTKGGAYGNADSFSKTLIFSAWKMVPRMVSALVSYEAERLSIGKLFEQEEISEKYSYKDKKRYPYPLLTFRKAESGLSGMNNLMLAYPSIYLASLYNPVENLIVKKDLSKIKSELKNKIISRLKALDVFSIGSNSSNVQKWDWLAVLLLDRNEKNAEELKIWLRDERTDNLFDNENETDNKYSDTHKSAKQIHFQEIRNYILTGNLPEVGRLNNVQLDKIAEHLAALCIGAPGVNALRSIEQIYPAEAFTSKMTGALNIGMGMISMFNKPESIAIVKVAKEENFYYQNVLSYAIDGNIQAMLDEFIYQLSDSGGIVDCKEAAELIKNILMVGGSKVDLMTENSIKDDKHFSMRTHYAVPFGTSESNDLKNGKRQIKVREAFNSPFRPFVLTSTSIGQEGLDFHYYCKKIIHWNLPNNPIDLEQREGRIKRYKSLLVRKNVADLFRDSIKSKDLEYKIWDSLFDYASHEKNACDLIPYWHLNTQNNRIDSLIPLYRYSKDIAKYSQIKSVLTNYRLTFGQPDQQDLIFAISKLSVEEQNDLKKVLINLCPLEFSIKP